MAKELRQPTFGGGADRFTARSDVLLVRKLLFDEALQLAVAEVNGCGFD